MSALIARPSNLEAPAPKPKKKVSSKRTASAAPSSGEKVAGGGGGKAGSAFRVAVRCRPLMQHERMQESVLTLNKGAVQINSGADDAERAAESGESPRHSSPRKARHAPAGPSSTVKSFSFDHVYDEFCTQDEVYSQFVAPFTAQFLGGYNVTLFAYGQTGTGKTYTVIGGDGYKQRGVVPRFVEDVFAHVASERAKAAEAEREGSAATTMTLSEAEAKDARPLLVQSHLESVGVTVPRSTRVRCTTSSARAATARRRGGARGGGGGGGRARRRCASTARCSSSSSTWR